MNLRIHPAISNSFDYRLRGELVGVDFRVGSPDFDRLLRREVARFGPSGWVRSDNEDVAVGSRKSVKIDGDG